MIRSFLHTLVSRPFVYSMCQATIGAGKLTQRIAVFARGEHGWVVDVGANQGYAKRLWPDDARYIALDSDLSMLRAGSLPLSIQGDATRLPLISSSIDMALCKQVSHHIGDDTLLTMFHEISRVLRPGGKFLFMDAVKTPKRVSKLLWRYDRGSNPRWEGEIRRYIDQYFEVDHVEHHWRFHLYVLYVLVPRSTGSESTSSTEASRPTFSAGTERIQSN